MCGITGILHPVAVKIAPLIRQMTDAQAHRGPDADGFYCDEKIGLGHRRLSIIDLSSGANQPMFDHSGRYVLVFNGEIYNYLETKSKLPDYPYQTDSDSEVILAAWIRWGKNCLEHLNGMFAFAIWDKMEQTLFVVRDRLGIKPLYFYEKDGLFLFASEIRALLATGLIPKKVNRRGLQDFMTHQAVHAPDTIVENVHQLMPGEYGFYKNGRFERNYYWKIEESAQMRPDLTRPEALKLVRSELFAAVERRMIADVPLGAFLSGGIDSSAIVAIMSEMSALPVNTCSIVFQEKDFDESHWSQLIAEKYRTQHTEVMLKPDIFLEELPAALAAMDSPSGDGINTFIVSKYTRKAGLTVALSGLGGDELFAGYGSFKEWKKLHEDYKNWYYLPKSIRNLAISGFQKIKNNRRSEKLGDILAAENAQIDEVYPYFRQLFLEKNLQNWLPDFDKSNSQIRRQLQKAAEKTHELPVLSQFSVAEIITYTQNVLLKDTDQMSMAHALEVREPFFDYKLVETVLGISDNIKFPNTPKQLLVDALHPLLPDEVVHRKKMGFTLPWEHWIRNELQDFCQTRLEKLENRGLFTHHKITELQKGFATRDPLILWSHIWTLVVLEEWLEKNEF
jgi:asparagine synthase (glutamine-hydrolysing)